MKVEVDARDLVKFVQNTEKAPAQISSAASRALNTVGDKVVDHVVVAVSSQTGLAEEIVRRHISIKRSTPKTLTYRIDAAKAMIEAPATRPMPGKREFKRRPDDYFHAQEMVNIVSMGDELVCQICQDLEDEGPYSIEEARSLVPAHPNCRCLVQPYRSRRELPVSFRKGKSVEIGTVTMDKLKEELGREMKITLKAMR